MRVAINIAIQLLRNRVPVLFVSLLGWEYEQSYELVRASSWEKSTQDISLIQASYFYPEFDYVE